MPASLPLLRFLDFVPRISFVISIFVLTSSVLGNPCPLPEVAPVDLGNLALGFVETGPGVFEGGGIGGLVRVSPAGLAVASNEVDGLANGADLHLGVQGAELALRPRRGSSSGGAVVVGPAGQEEEASTFRELEARGVVPGVDMVVEATQRRVNLLFSGSAQAFEGLEFLTPGAQEVRIDPQSGALELALPIVEGREEGDSPQSRIGTIELVALDSTGQRIEAAFTLNATGAVGILLGASNPGAIVEIVLTHLYAPFVGPADEVALLSDAGIPSGHRMAVGSTRAELGSARRRGFLVQVDALGLPVGSVTYLDFGSDLSLKGVAVTPSGGLVLAGQESDGEREMPFLANLDADGRGFEPSQALANALGVSAHDVEVASDGTVWVTGMGGGARARTSLEVPSGELGPFTLVFPVSEASARRLFVASVSPELERLVGATDLLVPFASRRIRAWTDCHGELSFGLPWQPKESQSVSHTYRMTLPSSEMIDCPFIDDGWGYAAMCWKWHKTAGVYSYHPQNIPEEAFPVLLVENPEPLAFESDYERLNQLEANDHGNLFFNTVSSTWSDPSGSWGHKQNWAYSREEIALAAAIYHDRWNSPAFANFRFTDGTISAVMMRGETFSADSEAELPHNVCDEDTDGDGVSDWTRDPYPTPPEYQVARACESAHSGQFELETVDFDAWLGGGYTPDQEVSGSEQHWWAWSSPYVGDPPEPGDQDQMTPTHLWEMSRRLGQRARTTVDLVLTRVEGGQVQSSTVLCGQVAAQDLITQAE